MNPTAITLFIYGLLIVIADSLGVWRPRQWIEVSERHFVYRRVRITGGVLFLFLGLVPAYFLLGLAGWKIYLLSVISGIFVVIGIFTLTYADVLRNMLISFGGLDDKILKIVFLLDGLFGAFLIALAFL
ncbi:hypothetical protein GOV10_00690 [Candidatus Woesearchaeota archaeon]|nr:hypothetical protein [Candidatus Woesearchaeota archaeon]